MFSSESAEIECTNLFGGLVTTKSSDHKRASLLLSRRQCEMVRPIMVGKSYVEESGKSIKGGVGAISKGWLAKGDCLNLRGWRTKRKQLRADSQVLLQSPNHIRLR